MTLEELRQAAMAGQPGARDALARRLRTMIWDGLSSRLPADAADDLTQQVMLKIFSTLEDFVPWHDNDAFERWVTVIYSRAAKHYKIDQYKARVRHLYDPSAAECLADAGAGPSTRLRNQDLLQAIARVVDKLATPYRAVVEAIINEERVKDFAAEQGLCLGTVYWRRSKARQLLTRELAIPTS